jgi:hypothetical protein
LHGWGQAQVDQADRAAEAAGDLRGTQAGGAQVADLLGAFRRASFVLGARELCGPPACFRCFRAAIVDAPGPSGDRLCERADVAAWERGGEGVVLAFDAIADLSLEGVIVGLAAEAWDQAVRGGPDVFED